MRFLITFNHIDGEWDRLAAEQQERHGTLLREFMAGLEAEKGAQLVFFQPVEQAKTVRMHPDGSIEVTDGPYREGAEQPGGYYIIEAESMDVAVEWARKGRFLLGSNEVREIVEFAA